VSGTVLGPGEGADSEADSGAAVVERRGWARNERRGWARNERQGERTGREAAEGVQKYGRYREG
jgi:hypothetical protein